MNKLFAGASLLLAMLLAACGDNGVRSPDFDAQLIDIIVDGPAQRVAGTQAQFRALGHFTTPPSTQGAVATSDITTAVDWSVVEVPSNSSGTSPADTCRMATTVSSAATINDAGLLNALSPATVYVKAQQKGGSIAGCRPFTITPSSGGCTGSSCPPSTVVLQSIQVTPTTATIPAGTTQQYCARGVYSDSPTPREITDTTVTWSSQNTAFATVPAAPNNTGSCIIANGVAVGSTNIVASATNSASPPQTLTASGAINVTSAAVKTVLRVEPPTATVVISFTQQFVACGTFSDGTQDQSGPCSAHPTPDRTETAGHAIANTDLNWTSGDNTIAAVDANGVAKGVKAGVTPITATLKDGTGDPAPAQRSAAATLTVSAGPLCTLPLLASQGATVTTGMGTLCLGCNVANPDFVIDAPPANPPNSDETAATMNIPVGVLDALLSQSFVTITVHSPTVIDPLASVAHPADTVGFIIERPAGDLATADVLGQATIHTTLAGIAAQDFTSPTNGADTLTVDALGSPVVPAGIPAKTRLLLYGTAVTKPFDAIELRFGPGVAGALSALEVFNVCSDVEVAPPAAQ